MRTLGDWAVFDSFKRPATPAPSWAGVVQWSAAIEARLGPQRTELAGLRVASDEMLATLGGDPNARDWTAFRPLRRHREEDWSDWLAQLIQDSLTGEFAHALLGYVSSELAAAGFLATSVQREMPLPGLRADIVVHWDDGSYSHIEVKVGDTNLSKTCDVRRRGAEPGGQTVPFRQHLAVARSTRRLDRRVSPPPERPANHPRSHVVRCRSCHPACVERHPRGAARMAGMGARFLRCRGTGAARSPVPGDGG